MSFIPVTPQSPSANLPPQNAEGAQAGLFDFLSQVKGVIHIGASRGQERHIYRNHDLQVLFVEAIPAVYERLKRRIRRDAKQRALNCLVTDEDDELMDFHIDMKGVSPRIAT